MYHRQVEGPSGGDGQGLWGGRRCDGSPTDAGVLAWTPRERARAAVPVGAELGGQSLTARASVRVEELGTIGLTLSFFVDSNPVGVGGDGALALSRTVKDPTGAQIDAPYCGLVPRYVVTAHA